MSDKKKASSGSAATKIGAMTGIAMIKGKWVPKGRRWQLIANTDSGDSTTSTSLESIVTKEQQTVQSLVTESGLPHQSRSDPSDDKSSGETLPRKSSINLQTLLKGASCSSNYRRSSSQIRTFDPNGRHQHESLHAASSYPPGRSSRSPSPARAASLDARCASSVSYTGNLLSGNASPAQTSSSVATGISSTYGSSQKNAVQGTSKQTRRCLSPLLIPSSPHVCISSDVSPMPPASPLGSLQPDLYQKRPVFLCAAVRPAKHLGRLHLRLRYDFDKSDLDVYLIEAHNLTSSDEGGFKDPYVRVTLIPEVDNRKRQTRTYRNNPNPVFDQHFKFPVSYEEMQEKILILKVLDNDRFSRNDNVGSVKLAMDTLELPSTSSLEVWGEITSEEKPPEEIQEIFVALSYLPSAERLTVLIMKARNLFPVQDRETLDPFAKVSLLCGQRKIRKKKKTAVRKATAHPVWNEAMSFDVPASLIETSAIEICVMDSSSEFGGNAIIGSCIIGPVTSVDRGNSQGREHWLQMTQSPRKQIAEWHTLR
ncbi:PREDICTED: synaptotagmin-5 [Cyphomyrmex costatus]|uniref:synaptotagmin-5 n=1 Tax=Cyphomyrmex costatus TaxID=456900 RepID=UPI0008522164|nr:PREDICTED: synaptotagmin-5 [Cyphomyrmex costatus]XP_018397474.1 PREDICTED: synaptotagmin-5 [Cyphomyrmex costatus]XP_018397475.1 PREDICTED: synaptotagmin-5 [Cyphomyrmex costatus]